MRVSTSATWVLILMAPVVAAQDPVEEVVPCLQLDVKWEDPDGTSHAVPVYHSDDPCARTIPVLLDLRVAQDRIEGILRASEHEGSGGGGGGGGGKEEPLRRWLGQDLALMDVDVRPIPVGPDAFF